MDKKEPKININGVEYNVADLSDAAKVQVQSLRFAEHEIKRINRELALVQTARNAYMQALQAELPEKS